MDELTVRSRCLNCGLQIEGIYGWFHSATLRCRCEGDRVLLAMPMPGAPQLPRKPEDYERDHPAVTIDGPYDVLLVELIPERRAQLDRIERMLVCSLHQMTTSLTIAGFSINCSCGWRFFDRGLPVDPPGIRDGHIESLLHPERTTDASTPQNPDS